MRRCKAEVQKNRKMISVEGMFHQWASDFVEFETGPGNYTVALIELDDGRIVKGAADTVVFLDKAQEREKGLEMSRELLRMCDQVWVFPENGISDGMKGEINFAGQLGKTVLYK